jgi:hypothetical protein
MNVWRSWVLEAPPTLLRAIARARRISVPRGCTHEQLARRISSAIGPVAVIRSTFHALPRDAQQLAQHLATVRRGVHATGDLARWGGIRPLAALLHHPVPQSPLEALALNGWLLPRSRQPRHQPRWLMPPEVRRAMPQRVEWPAADDVGAAPQPIAIRAVLALTLEASRAPLSLRPSGRLDAAALRRLRGVLAPAPTEPTDAGGVLWHWLLPLCLELGVVVRQGDMLVAGGALPRWWRSSAIERWRAVLATWIHRPAADSWLVPYRINGAGIIWPALRRRLVHWAMALPPGRWVDGESTHARLHAALGPLGDAHTHAGCVVGRSPWRNARAAAIWHAALAGPLDWLGLVVRRAGQVARVADADPSDGTITALLPDDAPRVPDWQFSDGRLCVRYVAVDADAASLAMAADTVSCADDGIVVTAPATRAAAGDAAAHRALVACLAARLPGAWPPAWQAWREAQAMRMTVEHALVLTCDQPESFNRLMRLRAWRRIVRRRLLPGIAIADRAQASALRRIALRHGVELVGAIEPPPTPGAAAPLSGEDLSMLLAVCRAAMAAGVVDAATAPATALARVMARLEAAGAAPPSPPVAAVDDGRALEFMATDDHDAAVALFTALIRRARRHRAALRIRYRAAGGARTLRTVVPLDIEQHGSERLLRAYCLHARDERSFRLDRIAGAQLVPWRIARGRPRRLVPARSDARAVAQRPYRGVWLEP